MGGKIGQKKELEKGVPVNEKRVEKEDKIKRKTRKNGA